MQNFLKNIKQNNSTTKSVSIYFILLSLCVVTSHCFLTKGQVDLLQPPKNIKNENLANQGGKSDQKVNQKNQQNSEFDYENDRISWPKSGKSYQIYSILNARLVIDVAKAPNGYHDPILYRPGNSKNQKFVFKKSYDNYYHIGNEYYPGQYLKKSQKTKKFDKQIVSFVKFSKGKDLLWRLIPAKENIPNSFYLVSESGMAIDVPWASAFQGNSLIMYDFHRHNNQIWLIKQNQISDAEKASQNSFQYEEKLSQMLYDIDSAADRMYQAFALEELKGEMIRKNMKIPEWFSNPVRYPAEAYDMPFETTYAQYERFVKEKYGENNETTKKSEQLEQKGKKENETGLKDQKKSTKTLKSEYIALQCAKNNKIVYVWLGGIQLPRAYKQLLQQCKQNVILLTDKDYIKYSQQWNALQNTTKTNPVFTIRQQVNVLKLLYLYFESGVYADFDTQINEECWQQVYTSEIVFTNRIDDNRNMKLSFLPVEGIAIPEENFMMVRDKLNPQVRRMIEQQILEFMDKGGDRWKECKYRQCLIVECQRHYRDNTYKKGYN